MRGTSAPGGVEPMRQLTTGLDREVGSVTEDGDPSAVASLEGGGAVCRAGQGGDDTLPA